MSKRYSTEFTEEDYSNFWYACVTQNMNAIYRYIKSGIDINKQDDLGITALMRTANEDVLNLLIDNGADLNIRDYRGNTALMRSAYTNEVNVCQLLIDARADVNIQNGEGLTALFLATIKGYTPICKLLLKAGAIPDIPTFETNRTALIDAAAWDRWDIVDLLLKYGANPDTQDNLGDTALTRAVANHSTNSIRALLKAGANVHIKNRYGRSFLNLVYDSILPDVMQFLPTAEQISLAISLKDYITIYSILPFVDEPISQSEYNKLIRSKRLEDKLRLIFAENVSKQTLLYFSSDKEVGWVAKERYKELRSKLGKRRYSAEFTEEDYLIFWNACGNNEIKIVRDYINSGINIDKQDQDGQTALMKAALHATDWNTETVRILIGAGANLDIQDDVGHTALMMTVWFRRKEAFQLLIDAGANTSLKNQVGKTFISYIDKNSIGLFYEYLSYAQRIKVLLPLKNYRRLKVFLPFTDEPISQSEYNQLIRSKRLEDKLRLIFAENVSKQTLLYFSSDKEVGWVAKERYKELRSKLGRRYYSSRNTLQNWTGNLSDAQVVYLCKYLKNIEHSPKENKNQLKKFIDRFEERYDIILPENPLNDKIFFASMRNIFKNRIQIFLNKLHAGSTITIYRAMYVSKDYLQYLKERGKHLGIYWTYDKVEATPYWGNYNGRVMITLKAEINSNFVDWDSTIGQAVSDYADDSEIKIFAGVPLKITGAWDYSNRELDISELNNKQFYAGVKTDVKVTPSVDKSKDRIKKTLAPYAQTHGFYGEGKIVDS